MFPPRSAARSPPARRGSPLFSVASSTPIFASMAACARATLRTAATACGPRTIEAVISSAMTATGPPGEAPSHVGFPLGGVGGGVAALRIVGQRGGPSMALSPAGRWWQRRAAGTLAARVVPARKPPPRPERPQPSPEGIQSPRRGADIVFVDANGNPHHLSEFRGHGQMVINPVGHLVRTPASPRCPPWRRCRERWRRRHRRAAAIVRSRWRHGGRGVSSPQVCDHWPAGLARSARRRGAARSAPRASATSVVI